MTIIGISGAIGSGKSFTQMKVALEYCERKQKQLVTNFQVSPQALYNYCVLKKYEFCKKMVLSGKLTWIVNPRKRVKTKYGTEIRPSIEALMIPESVVCLDEAGIFLNAREFARTSTELLADLCQSRKQGTDLVWAAQFDEQVDKQFRMLTQYWIHCDSVSMYSKKLRRPALFWKKIYWFKAYDYNYWQSNVKDRSSHFKTRFAYAFKYEGGLLNKSDRVIFNVFDSFSRLDHQSSTDHISSPLCCPLVQKVKQVTVVDVTIPRLKPSFATTTLPSLPPPTHKPQVLGGGGVTLDSLLSS